MTQYPDLSYPPLCNPVDPYAPSAPYSPVLYHVDADSRRFVSPLTWRPPLMAQDLPTMYLSAITTIHIRPYSGGVPLTIDNEALALIKVSDNNRNPLHLSYATPINNEYYEVIIDLIDHSDITYVGQGYMELTINNTVMLSDKCVIRAPLFPSNEQPPSPYGTIINVTEGTITLYTTPTLYQLSPIPSDQTELNLTFTPSNTDNIHKLLFHSEAPSLVINVDGASISGHYTGPGWYCAMMEERGSVITINLERLTDFTTESVYTVKGFNTILVDDEWPIYGRLDTLYIHTLTREARIWRNDDWWPVGSSEYKYAPKSETDPLPTGLVAAKGNEEFYAAGDHVHPFSIELTTNHLDTAFTTPTDTNVPSSKLVKDTLDQVQSDLEEGMTTLAGAINDTLSTKVDKVAGKELSTNDLTDALLETLEGSELLFNKDLNFDTPTNWRYPSTLAVSTALSTKVDKDGAKGLSDNNYTTEEKNKLASALTSLPNATTEAKGIIELATEAEVTGGTLTDRAVVPSTLKVELDKKVDKVSVTALPETPISGQMIRLTTADDTAKAAPGVYMHDGVGWTCISYESAYALGNLGATPSLSLIPGAAYTATVNVVITTFTVAFTRPGLASITLTNADTLIIAQPSMAGRMSKLLAEAAWAGAVMALSKALLEDDGVYLITGVGRLA